MVEIPSEAQQAALPAESGSRFSGRRWLAMALVLATGPVLYGAGLWAASAMDRQRPPETVCFDPERVDQLTAAHLTAATAMTVGAVLILFGTPWLLGTCALRRIERRRPTAGAWSLAVNSIALVLVFLVLRNTVEIGRASFLAAWLGWTGVLLLLAGKSPRPAAQIRSLAQRRGPGLAIGLAAVVLGITLFHREQFVQCFNGDGTETFQLARSLRDHFLPYWEMENWEIETTAHFGTVIVNPSLINSYWTCAWQLLLGEGELATRLPFWVWWLGIFAAALSMVQPASYYSSCAETTWLPAIPLALLVFLAGIWYTFYVGYYPYMTDLANPGVTDALFTLFLLLALDCLRQKDLAGWVVLMTLASLVLYAGPVMFVLTAAAALVWQPVPRAAMLRFALAGIGVLLGLVLFYLVWGWLDGSLPGWWGTIREEYIKKHLAAGPRWSSGLLFAGYFLLGCGGIPAIGLVRVFLRGQAHHENAAEVAWQRTAATMTLLYLLSVLISANKNLHYLGPLLPVCLILWLTGTRRTARRRDPQWIAGGAAAGLVLSIFLCWPASRDVFTLNRQLGDVTTFQTDSYQQACRWARITHRLYDSGVLPWQVGWHTWVDYSELKADPEELRPLLITDRTPPPAEGYKPVLESPEGVKLYSRDPRWTRWLGSRQPPGGSARFPWILKPIAIE